MDYKEAAETLEREAVALGLFVECEFVPWSRSRNAKEKHPSVNWRIQLKRSRGVGKSPSWLVWEGDYMQGSGYLKTPKGFNPRALDGDAAVRQACETKRGFWNRTGIPNVSAVEPALADILHSLLMDASAIDEGSFEDWASSLGYDPDSRKAEATWKAYVETGLKLRSALGDDAFRRFQELANKM